MFAQKKTERKYDTGTSKRNKAEVSRSALGLLSTEERASERKKRRLEQTGRLKNVGSQIRNQGKRVQKEERSGMREDGEKKKTEERVM